jgi:hypothetical protein
VQTGYQLLIIPGSCEILLTQEKTKGYNYKWHIYEGNCGSQHAMLKITKPSHRQTKLYTMLIKLLISLKQSNRMNQPKGPQKAPPNLKVPIILALQCPNCPIHHIPRWKDPPIWEIGPNHVTGSSIQIGRQGKLPHQHGKSIELFYPATEDTIYCVYWISR